MNHTRAQYKHAKQRALQRYDVEFNDTDIDKITELIRTNKTTAVVSQSLSRTVHDVDYQGMKFRVVYHKKTKTIATFLSFDFGLYGKEIL